MGTMYSYSMVGADDVIEQTNEFFGDSTAFIDVMLDDLMEKTD